jgi:hypothetical protein
MATRTPFKAAERDDRSDPIIEWYLELHGTDGTVEPVTTNSGHAWIGDHETANDIRLSVRRSARHHGASCSAWVVSRTNDWGQCYLDPDCDPDGSHAVFFALHDPDAAKAHLLHKWNGNPAQMRFNPYFKGVARRQQRDRPYAG